METETTNNPKEVKSEEKPHGDIKKLLPEPLLKLLRVAPEHPQLRSLVMAALKKAPPDEANTYYKLKEWVETNFESPRFEINHKFEPIQWPVRLIAKKAEHGTVEFTRYYKSAYNIVLREEELLPILLESVEKEWSYDDLKTAILELALSKRPENFEATSFSSEVIHKDTANIDNDIECNEEVIVDIESDLSTFFNRIYYRCLGLYNKIREKIPK